MEQNPKIIIKNIYYMLAYAFQVLRQSDFVNVQTEEFENEQNMFAAILSQGIGQQLKQGLYREYLEKKDDLTAIRGKIDIAGSIRNKISRRQVMTCEYDELSENNLLNRILKTTVMLLLRSEEVETKYKDNLKREMMFFSEVDILNPASIPWTGINFHRNNQTYQMLVNICQLILNGMLLTTESGETKLNSYVDDQRMSRLYEKFVLEYYRKEFPNLNASASQIAWAIDDDNDTLLPTMKSDIMLSDKDERNVLIIDTKYYSDVLQNYYENYSIKSQNFYQIYAYVKNKSDNFNDGLPHTVSGMLLYARTIDAVQPDESYSVHHNRFVIRTLDLNCEFSVIRSQLNKIVDDFFGK